jgi:Bacterial Ig-like domain/Protein of unknown function (DUF642)
MTTLPPGVTLQQIDGGPTYFADHGFTYAVNMGWDDPNFFSIGVWNGTMRVPSDATRWADLGLNTMVGLGPRPILPGDFTLMQDNGISYISAGPEFQSASPSNMPNWVGNISADEPSTFADGVSTPISTSPNAAQDHRFWYMNNNWYFVTTQFGGLSPVKSSVDVLDSLVATPNGTQRHIDLSSTDLYWFAGAKAGIPWILQAGGVYLDNLGRDMTIDEAARGSNYGDMVDNFRVLQAGHFPAPIPQFIETGGPYTEDTTGALYITPPELNWAVWSSLIHGAREIIYFNHSFGGPAQSFDNLAQTYYQTVQSGQTVSIYDQVKATDAEIHQLAPELNSPFAMNYVTVDGPHYTFGTADHTLGGLEVMAKDYNGQFYIFADTRDSETQHNIPATFTIADLNATSVTVVNENRTIPVTNGVFTDTFANAWTVHIYQVNDGPGSPGAATAPVDPPTAPPPPPSSSPPPPTNLIVNGGFETGDFTGWTKSGNVAQLSIGPQLFITSSAHSGQDAAGFGSVGSDGTISQNLTTVVGQSYTLDFWLANAAGGPNDFTAEIGGVTELHLVNAAAQPYTHYDFTFTATSTSTPLEFDFRQDPSEWHLDDVSVVQAIGSAPPDLPPTPPAAPVIASFSPDTAPVGDGHTTATSITLTGTGEANSTVNVFDGTTSVGHASVNASGDWSLLDSGLTVGPHSFTATDTDANGTSAASAVLAVTVDAPTAPPPPPSASPPPSHNHGHDWSAWQEFHALV